MGAELHTRRNLIMALGAGALTMPFGSWAQQGKVWRVGYLDLGSRQSMLDSGGYAALMEGLHEHGYVEGKNLVLEARYADGNADRLSGLAAELVRQKVNLIVARGAVETPAAEKAMATMPIVLVSATDPVGNGFGASLARPGRNVTGMSSGADETVQKLVELLIVAVPKLKRIAVLTNPANRVHPPLLSRVQAAGKQAGKQILPISARTLEEIERGFAGMMRERADAVMILIDPFLAQQRTQIAGLALRHKLPSIYQRSQHVEVGGLMSYGSDFNDNFRRAGIFVDKILKGTKPGDIPFEQPTRYYFVINRKTANTLGIKISGELLARADKVIE
jgi:putative ABC transport system substrate-binding protein